MRNIYVVDFETCNLGSLTNSIKELNYNPIICTTPQSLEAADKLILPGVGAYNKGMSNLRKLNMIGALKEKVLHQKRPILGICLGMQLMASQGEEGGHIDGLGFIPGTVKLLKPIQKESIPHVGWNSVYFKKSDHTLFKDIKDGSDFYFVHSYHFSTQENANALAKTPYCGEFSSVVGHENIMGTQFHPEKSSKNGLQLIKNFLTYA